jgi:signal transduction histidine kinase
VPDAHLPLFRRPRIRIAAFTVAVLLSVAILETAHLRTQRNQTLEAATERADDLALVLRGYLQRSISLAETSLRQLAIHAQRAGGSAGGLDEWEPMLTAAGAVLPGRGSISVVDADGIIRHSTLKPIVGESRRDYLLFRNLATGSASDVVVDLPLQSRSDAERYVIPIGVRLEKRDGTFDGVVVATLAPDDDRGFYRTVNVGRLGSVSVLHSEGAVIVREPAEDPNGERAEARVILETAHGRSAGVIDAPLEAGGPPTITAFRTVATPPLVVAVSLDKNEVLAAWRHQARTSALAFAALSLTLTGLISVLFRQMDARARAEAHLAEVQRLESERLREANERLAEALEREQRARHEVEEASYLKDEFLMTVSHELRTPLTAIHGWVHMLSTQAVGDQERSRALAAVERNARAQTRLVDDLLDVSRAISGKLRIEPRPVQVDEIIASALEAFDAAIAAKSLMLERRIEPNLPVLHADPDRLQQVIWNLLSNAVKFTPPDGTMRIAAHRRGNAIEIEVSDSGAGISADFLPHVFERFRQGEVGTRRRFGGLGLGLAIVRHIVELHGGTVRASSQGEGSGATFTVTLPLTELRSRGNSPTTTS